ncbi:hypothetical protein OH76DRAFT_1483344 [Lentinus brumalis]|uniref:NAD(P)-binding protein n=1 Tax=Lentinus brumalis TaxID=2498619 RepID=A0A371D9B0_9APHY|nr:hypothetical protein OH76DRAFT_1483344 [Polyporus brumalis]
MSMHVARRAPGTVLESGVVHSVVAFLPLLRAAPTKKIVVVNTAGADLGFIRAAAIADAAAYGMTKAAALIATTKWAVKLQDEGFMFVMRALISSATWAGEVLSKKGVSLTIQTPKESVSAQLEVVDSLKPFDNGLFLAYTGGEYRV